MTTAPSSTEIDPKAFRRALGNFATGVTIITARAPDGTLVGVTASSFNSLSMDPPLILWSSMKEARSCAIFESASHFAVNVLAADQMDMSNHFARQQKDKFAGIEWEVGIGGAPIFPNCAARFQCETYDKLDGGDHWIFVGKVVAFDDFGRSPLCFHQGSYAMVFNHPGTFPKGEPERTSPIDRGRAGNHEFFLMLRAVRAYQDRYQPKLEALNLNVIEARILLILHDLSCATPEELVPHLHAPINEAQAALQTLTDNGYLALDGDITTGGESFCLTEKGKAKADECWNVAEAHAKETFEGFSEAQVEAFTGVLRQLIAQ